MVTTTTRSTFVTTSDRPAVDRLIEQLYEQAADIGMCVSTESSEGSECENITPDLEEAPTRVTIRSLYL